MVAPLVARAGSCPVRPPRRSEHRRSLDSATGTVSAAGAVHSRDAAVTGPVPSASRPPVPEQRTALPADRRGCPLLPDFDHVLTDHPRRPHSRLDLERPVEPAVITECLELAAQAPTGSNIHSWRFLVVTDPDLRAAIAEYYRQGASDYLAAGGRGRRRRRPAARRAVVDLSDGEPAPGPGACARPDEGPAAGGGSVRPVTTGR